MARLRLFLFGLFCACGDATVDAPDARLPAPDAAPTFDAAPVLDAAPCVAPAAPAILSPLAGSLDTPAGGLTIVTSAFAGPLTHAATELELYEVSGSGAIRDLVWSARVTEPSRLTRATLADGSFAEDVTELEPWGRYAARARHVASGGDGCSVTTVDSSDVHFRIDDGSAVLFDPDTIRTIELELSPETMELLDAEAIPPNCFDPFERTYRRGDAVIDGVRYEHVGVKIKGSCGSSRNLDEKAAFKIKLDWDDPDEPGCPEERRHAGQGSFTINNMVQDASLAHERLAYAFYAALGVPAPRAASVRLVVNGDDWGIYLDVESFSGRFVARHFANNDGMAYEGEGWCDLDEDNIVEDDLGCFQRESKVGPCDEPPDDDEDPQDFSLLRELVAQLDALPADGFYPAIDQLIDWERFLDMWAADAVLVHWDGYSAARNNYRIYHDPSDDRWTLIPWGTDQTFSRSQERTDPFGFESRLARACSRSNACSAAFAERLEAAIALFESMGFEERRLALDAQLRPELIRDAGRGPTLEAYGQQHIVLKSVIQNRGLFLRRALSAHGF